MKRQRGKIYFILVLCLAVMMAMTGCSGAKSPEQSDSRNVVGKEIKPDSVAGGTITPTAAPTEPSPTPTQIAVNTPEPTANPTNPPLDGDAWEYRNDVYGFTLTVAPGWELGAADATTAAVFMGPSQSSEYPMYPNATTNVIINTIPGFDAAMLDEYIAYTIDELAAAYSNFNLLDQQECTLGGNAGRMIHYTISQSTVTLELMQIIGYRGSDIIVWTYAGLPGQFDEHLENFVIYFINTFTF